MVLVAYLANAMLSSDNNGVPLDKTRGTANNDTTMIFIKRTWHVALCGVGDIRPYRICLVFKIN
jgi:hypothetical protein